MMHQAEKQEKIPIECYGSRKNHEAIEVATNRWPITDLLRRKHFPGAIASVDAHTCYGCIQRVAGSLCAQSWDVSSWGLIAFFWDNGQWHHAAKTAFPGDLTISNMDGTRTVLVRHDPDEAIKVVGV
jgi:hypothetical protein